MIRLAMLSMHTSPMAPPGVGDGGGMNVYIREISGALAREGAQVDVYTLGDGRQSDVIDLRTGLRVHHLDVGAQGLDKFELPAVAERFADAVADHLADNGGVDVIHAHYWLSGLAGHRLKHNLDIPLITSFHTLGRVKNAAGVPESESRARAEAEIMVCSDAIIGSCPNEVDDLRDHYNVTERVHMITPGVDPRKFSPDARTSGREALGLAPNRPLILFAGRIQKIKGLDVAINALDRVRNTHRDALLVVVGGPSGNEGEACLAAAHSLVAEKHLEDNVVFTGPQPRQLLASYYRAADICIVPSHSESFGLVALEAAASGTPVVASAVGGQQIIVRDQRTGLLVEPGDIEGFANALTRLLDNPAEAKAFGAAGAEHSQRFTWPRAANRTYRLYDELLTGVRAGATRPVDLSCLSA